MTLTGAKAQRSAKEKLLGIEELYAPALRGASLAVESNFDESAVRDAAQCLGAAHRKYDRQAFLEVTAGFPASAVIAMVGVGLLDYRDGTFWDYFYERAGMEKKDSVSNTDFASLFHGSVGRLGLVDFGELPINDQTQRHVGAITFHAGVPLHGMADYLSFVLTRMSRDPGISAGELLAWCADPEVVNRMADLPKPVQRFLSFGGEFSLDILDRTIELLDHWKESGDLSDLTWETTGLPTLILDKMIDLIQSGDVVVAKSFSSSSAARARRAVPTLTYHPDRGAIEVNLPPVKTQDGSVTWVVSADGRRETIESWSEWHGAGTAPGRRETLQRPTKNVEVTSNIDSTPTAFRLISEQDPLLLFDAETLRYLPVGSPVPSGRIWAVHPQAAHLVDAEGNEVRSFEQGGLPISWSQWVAKLYETSQMSSISLRRSETVKEPRRRFVRQSQAPEVRVGPPDGLLTTRYGEAVHPRLPSLAAPAFAATASWKYSVSRGGRELVKRTAAGSDVVDLNAIVPRPHLGAYAITVDGGLGRRASKTVVVVQGLRSSASTSARLFVPGGDLTKAKMTVETDPTLSLTWSSLDMKDWREQLVISHNGVAIKLWAEVPSMAAALDVPGRPGNLSNAPVVVTHDQLPGGTLRIKIPGQPRPVTATLTSHDRQLSQTLRSTVKQDVHRFELRPAQTLASEAGRADVTVNVGGADLVIARIKPPVVATGAVWEQGRIRLENLVWNSDLRAGIYQATAPWAPVRECAVDPSGFVDLPDELPPGGSLRVLLREHDEWSGDLVWPDWPVDKDDLVVHRPGSSSSADDEVQQISQILAGERNGLGPFVVKRRADIIGRALKIPDLRTAIREVLLKSVLEAGLPGLVAFSQAGLANDELVRIMVRSGFFEYRWAVNLSRTEFESMWVTAPLVASFVALQDLEADGELDDETAACLAGAAGSEVLLVASGQGNPSRDRGRFDISASAMAAMNPDRQQQIWDHVNPVPQGWLDADGRFTASRELFDAREALQAAIGKDIPTVIRGARTALQGMKGTELYLQFESRLDIGQAALPWQKLPAVSFGLAAMARSAARDPNAPSLSAPMRAVWGKIADIAPQCVCMDVVLAESLLQGAQRGAST